MKDSNSDFERYLAIETALREILFMYKSFAENGGLEADFATEDGQFN